MAMYTLKGIGEISTDAFDEKITLRNLLQHISLYDFIILIFFFIATNNARGYVIYGYCCFLISNKNFRLSEYMP